MSPGPSLSWELKEMKFNFKSSNVDFMFVKLWIPATAAAVVWAELCLMNLDLKKIFTHLKSQSNKDRDKKEEKGREGERGIESLV